MALSLSNITFDCDDPIKVSAFWAAALGKRVDEGGSPYFCSIGRPTATPTYFFIKVPEAKTAKNRVHLDLQSDDRLAEVARLVGLGATHVRDHDEWGHQWSVMADVEGNEFCVS